MSVLSVHNVTVIGEGDTTLFLSHGFGCDQSMFRHLTEDLRKDHRIVLYDLAGAGQYDMQKFDPDRYQSLDGYADDVIKILDALSFGPINFVGHSVSAMVGVLAANQRPGLFDRLVLIGPSPRYINEGDYVGGFSEEDISELLATIDDNYMGWSQVMAPAIVGNPECPQLGEELTTSFCRTDQEAARIFATATFRSDNRDDLKKMSHPALVLQCKEDIIASENVGEYVHAALPNSTYTLLDARGHCPHLSNPGETIAAIRTFLEHETVTA